MNQAVANIIRTHLSGLDFVDKIAGLVSELTFEMRNEKNEIVNKTFPVACCVSADDCKEGAYNDLMPNSQYKTVIYFEDGGVSFDKVESNWKYYKSKLRLICWINVAKILEDTCKSGATCTLSSHFIAEIIRVLPLFPQHHTPFNFVYSEITSQVVRNPSIFGAYSYDEKHAQYLMYPYDYFALEIETSFALCLTGTGVYTSACNGNVEILDAPVAGAATDITESSFKANWSSVTGATGYIIEVATDTTFETIIVDEDVDNNVEATITGLTFNTNYYYRVRAYSDTDTSDNSNTATLKTSKVLYSDADNNLYTPVTIGNQIWMKENLRTTKYNDDTPILNLTDNTDWSADVIGAFCYYNNDVANKATYGAMYDWHTINNAKGIAPVGCRIPTYDDLQELIDFVGDSTDAGGILKELGLTHWEAPNTGATDAYAFTHLPGGARNPDGTFQNLGKSGSLWSSTEFDATNARYRNVAYNSGMISNTAFDKHCGFSIRCLKDI